MNEFNLAKHSKSCAACQLLRFIWCAMYDVYICLRQYGTCQSIAGGFSHEARKSTRLDEEPHRMNKDLTGLPRLSWAAV
jgi:hypothetical protein